MGRTRALRCIAHVHVLVALDAAAPPLRNHGVGASWTLLGGCSRMLFGSMVRHVVAWDRCVAHQWHFPSCSVTRTHSICKRHVAL